MKQIQVLFEDKRPEGRPEIQYFHWVTDRAVKQLIDEGFLRKIVEKGKYYDVIFVLRSDVRYFKRSIKERIKLIDQYSSPDVTEGLGDYAEELFLIALELNDFEVIGRETNEYMGRKWTETDHDLDYIVERDDIVYGAEVKNTLGYIEAEDFKILLNMCDYLEVKPLCIFRFAPKIQINEIRRRGGFAWIFKTQIYPPGNRTLVNAIYNTMDLPVRIWRRVPDSTVKRFLDWHERQIEK